MTVTMRPSTTPNLDLILQTIRTMESHNNYQAQNRTSSASGAYQIIDSTWHGFGGYVHAKDAPPAVQDDKARQMVLSYLQRANGDVSAVPQYWYYPAGVGKPNLVPPGNSLSMGQYTTAWLKVYHSLGGSGSSAQFPTSTGNAIELASSTSGGFKEHCLIRAPKASFKVFGVGPTLGGNCLFSTNQARAVGGALMVGMGSVVLLLGISLLVVGKVSLPGVPGAGFLNAAQDRSERRRFDRAAEQGASNERNAPMHDVGGRQTMGNYEEPF